MPPSSQDARRETGVAYILSSFPRLSQTFVLNEILALERLGIAIRIFAMRDSGESLVQKGVERVQARVDYLGPAPGRSAAFVLLAHLRIATTSPRRYAATFLYVLRRRDLDAGYTTCSRFCCFGQAVQLAGLLRRRRGDVAVPVSHTHAHFAHDPTLVALLLKKLTGLPYSFTAHARDLYQTPARALAERVAEASAVVTICRANLDYLRALMPDLVPGKVRLIHCGVDLQEFRPPERETPPIPAPLILSVGRLVEKKGFSDLLAACRRLKDAGRAFRCEIYGDGPLRVELQAEVQELGLGGDVTLAGARTQTELRGAFQRAAVFALTPCVAHDGDRDGIPVAILEAMAFGLPVVSTAVAGVPEAVIHDRTGLLAEPHDIASIAKHLAALLADEPRRRRLGQQARLAVGELFDAAVVTRQLAELLDGRPEGQCALSS
jgi:glycosyltransferase involved in cell wall biosynthesis